MQASKEFKEYKARVGEMEAEAAWMNEEARKLKEAYQLVEDSMKVPRDQNMFIALFGRKNGDSNGDSNGHTVAPVAPVVYKAKGASPTAAMPDGSLMDTRGRIVSAESREARWVKWEAWFFKKFGKHPVRKTFVVTGAGAARSQRRPALETTVRNLTADEVRNLTADGPQLFNIPRDIVQTRGSRHNRPYGFWRTLARLANEAGIENPKVAFSEIQRQISGIKPGEVGTFKQAFYHRNKPTSKVSRLEQQARAATA